ncbi:MULTISPECIES: sensor histidine kinase [Clostridiaceae]|uniref:histidine kinase n=1 Tax=Clostridium facile TaxID=2763035 RepID=A0ABR7IQU3_9CLOT|nr:MULTISPECIES: HAMP domain-containing sensor histidine kinase [Clostridiaceae]MBC5787493.1 HAMP domain-containing histidine kinase [Clostridium facile]
MTIKKRMFISNILMIIIPAFLAVIILAGCLFIFLASMFPHAEYRLGFQEELTETRYEVVELVREWLDKTDPETEAELLELVQENRLTLQIYQGQQIIQRFGDEVLPQKQLEQSLAALDGSGTVSNGTFALFGEQLLLDGKTYQIHIYNPVVILSHDRLKLWVVGIGFFMVVVLVFIIFITNRFLIKFVFKRISDPLQTLAEGVHQIRDGNLTHRIFYSGEDEFKPVCEDFNEMAERLRISVVQLQKEEESRKELLASISHDIRSPLTSIRAYVDGLLDGIADTKEKQKAYLGIIQKKTSEIDQMVKKLFLFSKMDIGEYPYSPEILDVSREMEDFITASEEEYQHRGLNFQNVSIPQESFICADPTYFRSILTNLLDNSAKYKEKETVSVSITGERFKHRMVVYVDDDGPGVPEDALPKLFDVFYRNDLSRNNPNQGSGLGLAIVAKAVERMDGAVHAENLPQGGLRMVLEFPTVKGE